MVAGSQSFGPGALATPANALTLLRMLGAPVLMALVLLHGPSWRLVVLWALLAATDGADGWIARRQGATRSGAFLDPLADKALVLGALVALVARSELAWLPVLVIGLRELAMSLYRSLAGRRGVSVPASRLAKLKTLSQDLLVGAALVPLVAAGGRGALLAFTWVVAALSVVSGAQYARGASRA